MLWTIAVILIVLWLPRSSVSPSKHRLDQADDRRQPASTQRHTHDPSVGRFRGPMDAEANSRQVDQSIHDRRSDRTSRHSAGVEVRLETHGCGMGEEFRSIGAQQHFAPATEDDRLAALPNELLDRPRQKSNAR